MHVLVSCAWVLDMLGFSLTLGGMQGHSGPEMAEAMGLAIRDVSYCCELLIQQQIIAKTEEKNFVLRCFVIVALNL